MHDNIKIHLRYITGRAKKKILGTFFNQDNNDSLCANPLAGSVGQVKLDLDK
jgi:hypothetical protein